MEEKKQTAVFVPRKKEWLLVLLSTIAAYIYVSSIFQFPGEQSNFWIFNYWQWSDVMTIFVVFFLAAGASCAYINKIKIEKEHMIFMAFTVAGGFWFLIFRKNVDQDITGYLVLFLHLTAVYWLVSLGGKRLYNCLNECCILDLLKGLFCFPAMHGYRLILACCNGAACLVNKSKRNQQQMKQALLGILFSIPLFLIVICLLVTADHTFWQFCNNISSLAQPNSLTIIQLIMTGIVALYLFGLFYGCFYVASQGKTKKLTVAPSVASGFMILFLLVYTLFFVVKLGSIPASLRQIEEGTLLTSTYARNGFFQLCWIASINFVIFTGIKWYAAERKKSLTVQLSILGFQTLGFIILAFSRMQFYIVNYGLTFKRVFTTWFMGVLFITFLLMILSLMKKFNAVRLSVYLACTSFLILAYSNIPAWVYS
ncbi:DUF4153 domain-containing protein [Lachnoclostridium edouardi]|uniref:DUF4153 domain-containing protein n=1 Tax=Lachnoclostridium edouardi TaxID=1926283 RepID=UPI000C7C32ED|nr:DUF4173 domain-containing protein [Lachnoclostridium edouardi]